MTLEALRDATHVIEHLSPEQNDLLDRWSDRLQEFAQRAVEHGVDEFQVVACASALAPGKLVGAEVNVEGAQIPIVLYKKGRSIVALSATCTHWDGPLAEGKLIAEDCIECPWHASQFSLADGSVRQGPVTVATHVFEARIKNGNVEVRRRA